MADPIVSDLLILAVTPLRLKFSAGLGLVLRATICGFLGPDVRCAQVKGESDIRGASRARWLLASRVAALGLHFLRFCKRVCAWGSKE